MLLMTMLFAGCSTVPQKRELLNQAEREMKGVDAEILTYDSTNQVATVRYHHWIVYGKMSAVRYRFDGNQWQRIRASVSVVPFPQMPSLDARVYENIQQACRERWHLDAMRMETFTVVPDRDGYLVKCEGVDDDELYLCTIRVDGNGKWINDGRVKHTE